MSATDLLIWGIVVHLVVDWLGQNEWMAVNKMKRRVRFHRAWTLEEVDRPRMREGAWWDRHPAAYVHAGLHGAAQLLVFPWYGAFAIGFTHLIIDTRWPVQAWSKLIRQTQPSGRRVETFDGLAEMRDEPVFDIGTEVRIWADQCWHIGVIALVALAVTA